jgi:hypothetical protein
MGRRHGVGWTIVLLGCFALVRAEEKPGLSLKFGFSERVRNEYYNNITDMSGLKDDKTDYFRIRTSLWGQVRYAPMVTLVAKLTNEFRKYAVDPNTPDRAFTFDEIFVDNLYLKLETPNKRIGLTLGRQNLTYGEGFILMDGSPWDGSRSIYHDAAKLSLTAGKTTVDFLAIDNTRIEDHLSVIRGAELSDGKLIGQSPDQKMNDGEEKAFGLYATTTVLPKTKLEAYAIRKTEEPKPWIDKKGPTETLELNTLGARAQVALASRLSLTAEAAVQSGTQGSIDHKAFGGYGTLTFTVDPETKSAFSAGVLGLSGDDPKTADNEGWNPLFSRWPKWSELYIYSYLNETVRGSVRVAYWTNIWSPNLSYTTQLSKRTTLIANYFWLRAFEDRTLADGSASGLSRGKEIQFWVKFNFNKYLTGHLLYDFLTPGDYYAMPRSGGSFIRGEMMVSI